MGEFTRINLSRGWLPDFLPHEMPDGGCVECKNLLPYTEFFAAAYSSRTHITSVLSGTPLHGEMFRDTNGIKKTYIGTTTKLYEVYGTTLTDKTITATAGYTSGISAWDMAQYGNYIIATNNIDPPQILKGFTTSNFTNMASASACPSTAKYIHFNNGHLIFGNTDLDSRALEWSSYTTDYDIENFTPSLTTGAGNTVLTDSDGEITGIAPLGEMFAVFHQESITLGYYTGFPYTFNFRQGKVRNVGGIQGTLIPVGNAVFFWDYRDIYVFDGNVATPIGGGVRRQVLDNLNLDYIYRISSTFDPFRGLIYWAYPSVSSSNGTPDKILVYNVESPKFSWLDVDVDCLFRLTTGGITMDNIDSIYTDIDQMPYTMDSSKYGGSVEVLGCCTSNLVSTFDGAVLAGEIVTRELSSGEDVLHINRIRPNAEEYTASSITGYVGSRMTKVNTPSWSSGAVINTSDNIDLRASGRLLRVKLIMGSHLGIGSIDVDVKKVSGR